MKSIFIKIKLICLLIIITSCAAPLVKLPEAKSVKKIGIISLYMEERLASKGGIAGLVEGVKKIKGENPNEYAAKQIIESAFRSYKSSLNSLNRWEVVDTKDLIAKEDYKKYFGQIEGDDLKNSNLSEKEKKIMNSKVSKKIMQVATSLKDVSNRSDVFVPFENMAALTIPKNQSKSKQLRLRSLGNLAKKLNLDAVVIIKFDIGAKRTGGMSVFQGSVYKALPTIYNTILVVNQDGDAVIDSQRKPLEVTKADKQVRFYARDKNKRFKGYVFYDKDNKVKTYIKAAISDAASNMRSQIEMGFIK